MVESSGKNRTEWYDECVALQQEGELAAAVSELRKLVEAHPDYGLARLALGVFLYQKGDEEGALESLKTACELEQDDPFYFTALSAVAIKLGDHDRAEAALMQAQEIRIAAQIKKMRELRDKELAAREERDRLNAESSSSNESESESESETQPEA